jgi:hypothetical protein
MHALSFHRRRLRRTVWLIMIAWLFALTSGVVNACLLVSPGAERIGVAPPGHSSAGTPEKSSGLVNDIGRLGHVGPDAPSEHEQGAGADSCLKFCDDGSSALSKSTSSTADPGVSIFAAVAPWCPIVSGARLASRLSLGEPTAHGPPVVIRFLRLTL